MEKFNTLITNISNGIAQFFLAFIMVLVVCNVIMRILGSPIMGTVEFVGYLAGMATSLALGYCAMLGGHIAVDFFFNKLNIKWQKVMDIIVNLVISLFLLLLLYRTAIYANQLRLGGDVSLTTGLPYYPVAFMVVLGFGIYFIVSLGSLLESINKVGQK